MPTEPTYTTAGRSHGWTGAEPQTKAGKALLNEIAGIQVGRNAAAQAILAIEQEAAAHDEPSDPTEVERPPLGKRVAS